MKRIFNFSLAVIALTAAAASCSKEMASPAEEEVIKTVPTTFTASLDADKAGLSESGKQVLWESGDKIAVYDGTAIREFTLIDGEGTTSATFYGEVAETAENFIAVHPFASANKVTPAAEETPASISISVPATQTIASGSLIDPAALVAVAESADSTSLAFKNVVSLVKFTVDAEGVTTFKLSGASGEKFTGTASVGTDAVATSAGNTASLTVKPAGESFATGTYYAAVLPTAFSNGLTLAVNKTDGAALIKTTDKSNEFVRNAGCNLGNLTSGAQTLPNPILTPEQFRTFAQYADVYAAGTTVELGANISLAGFDNDVLPTKNLAANFDGKGYCLSDIALEGTTSTISVFASVSGTIQNLNIGTKDGTTGDGSYIKSTCADDVSVTMAAIASITGSGNAKNIKNFAKVEYAGTAGRAVTNGGCIGSLNSSGSVEDCANYGYVTASTAVPGQKEGDTGAVSTAGVIASVSKCSKISGCTNYGHVSFAGATHYKSLNMGGVIGYISAGSKISGCSNEGLVELESTTNVAPDKNIAKIGGQRSMGGVVGYNNSTACTIENCTNNGSVERNGGTAEDHANYMGGILGYSNALATKMISCTNGTDGTIKNTKTSSGRNLYMGGILGYGSGAAEITKSQNKADITNSHTATLIYLGGIAGYIDGAGKIGGSAEDKCENSGKISSTYKSSNGSSNANPNVGLGGIAGRIGAAAVSWCDNKGSEVSQTAGINYSGNIYAVAGICGTISKGGSISHCNNVANITQKGGTSSKKIVSKAGGIAGYIYNTAGASISDCTTSGKISVSDYNSQGRAGGILGNSKVAFSISNCSNSGNVEITGVTDSYFYFGGILGDIPSGITGENLTISGCTNTGDITIDKASKIQAKDKDDKWACGLRFGGIVGCVSSPFTISSCINEGDVINNSDNSAITRIGGICGSATTATSTYENCTNTGDVINNGTAVDNTLDMGGIIPYVGSGCTVNGCVNSGNITNTCISLTTERLGGIFGYFGGTTKITDCRATGNVIGASLDTKIGVIAGAPNNNPTVSGCSVGPCEVGLAGSTVTITAENYVDYLRGSSDTKATNLNATNVSFIAE